MEISLPSKVHSLYLHIPFCRHRCAYCDFNTYAGQAASLPKYVEALSKEIQFVGQRAPEKISLHTVYFGGGTPSLMSPAQFESILKSIGDHFILLPEAEISIEANPGTCSFADLLALRELGVNRISFGVESANSEELRMLERAHDFFDVIEAVAWARKAGFENLSLDLIYGLPEQNLQSWQRTLQRSLDLHPEHISAYALTLEHSTPLGRWSARGLLPIPDPDLAAEMYEWAEETFQTAGYHQYEISNWSRPGRECGHNLQYWRGLPYLGLGAGAHGYANDYRYSNVLRIKTYIERINQIRSPKADSQASNIEFPLSPATVNQHKQSLQDDMSELMITGLRLTCEGIASQTFRQRFGYELGTVYSKEIDELTRLGLLEWIELKTSEPSKDSEVLRLTPRGRLVGNQVFIRFVR
jgi:oxygen-independent coproporphyrinogen-3 oxidase